MAQVQCLAYAVLVWVGFDDALFYLDGFCHHALQLAEVGCVKIECHQFCPCAFVGDESVLEHLGIARADVVVVECVKELCVDDDEAAVGEHADFVLKSAEVDACLASHRSVYHCQERCGYIDEVDASLECACRKASEVGHHSASEIYHQRVACGSAVAQRLPHLRECVEVFVSVGGFDDYWGAVFECFEVLDFGPAQLLCCFVGEYENAVVLTF